MVPSLELNCKKFKPLCAAVSKQAAAKVIERARQTGTPVILWENGRIIERSWEELINPPTTTPNQSLEGIREDHRKSAPGQARDETGPEQAENHAS
jgi:hypothetical protein